MSKKDEQGCNPEICEICPSKDTCPDRGNTEVVDPVLVAMEVFAKISDDLQIQGLPISAIQVGAARYLVSTSYLNNVPKDVLAAVIDNSYDQAVESFASHPMTILSKRLSAIKNGFNSPEEMDEAQRGVMYRNLSKMRNEDKENDPYTN